MIAGKQFAPCFCFACLPVYKQDGYRERPQEFLYCVCLTLLCFGSDNSFIEYKVYNLGCLHTKYSWCNILWYLICMSYCHIILEIINALKAMYQKFIWHFYVLEVLRVIYILFSSVSEYRYVKYDISFEHRPTCIFIYTINIQVC